MSEMLRSLLTRPRLSANSCQGRGISSPLCLAYVLNERFENDEECCD